MEFGGSWYWITAGHIVGSLQIVISRGKADSFRLVDTFGHARDYNSIPFEFVDAWKTSRYDEDEGLDYAAVELPGLIKRALQQNGIAPVSDAEWRAADYRQYSDCVMLGLPTDDIHRMENADVIFGRANPSLIHTKQLLPIPAEFEKPSPRLIAAINQAWPAGSVDGMSGGPVFGFDMRRGHYEVVAVQSHWRERERIIAACPISVFGQLVEREILARAR